MDTKQFRYKELYYITYVLYITSFFTPAYAGGSMSFCCGGTEIFPGWKCALAAFTVIFYQNFILGILLSVPNLIMILLLFVNKRIGKASMLIILLFNVSSCSYWWVQALVANNMSNLLSGYWLWLLSIAGNNIILLLSRRK